MYRRTVLVVDSDLSAHQQLVNRFRERGFRVEAASSVAEALKVVLRNPPAVVLLGLKSGPVADSWAFVEGLAARGIRLPIVALSNDPIVDQWAREIGAVAYLREAESRRDAAQRT